MNPQAKAREAGQGVAGVVVAGDFLAFGQGFTDDRVVGAFKDFARALGDFGGRHGGGKKADEDGEKLGFDVFHGTSHSYFAN